jgi:hypothetical protein
MPPKKNLLVLKRRGISADGAFCSKATPVRLFVSVPVLCKDYNKNQYILWRWDIGIEIKNPETIPPGWRGMHCAKIEKIYNFISNPLQG